MIAKRESDLFNLKVLLPIILIITLTKFVIYKGLFLNQNTRNSKIFLLAVKKSYLCACLMARTIILRLKSGQLIASQI